jgi:hypothetical protein
MDNVQKKFFHNDVKELAKSLEPHRNYVNRIKGKRNTKEMLKGKFEVGMGFKYPPS